MELYEKRGYLNSEFKLFHLTDTVKQDFEYHYHEFDKIIILIQGCVDYMIEGRSYHLQPYDIVLVNHNHIHKPNIDDSVPYERIIVYLSPNFITSYQTETYDLSSCFQQAAKNHSHVLRIHALKKSTLFQIIRNLEHACCDSAYANDLYCQVLFLEFMIQLNRAIQNHTLQYLNTSTCNRKLLSILDYINQNLTDDLTIDLLSKQFYISKYHLMRIFKEETGYTIGTYITDKRLMMAKELLGQDIPITEICFLCGFKNYSTFSRAYKTFFGKTPQSTRLGLKDTDTITYDSSLQETKL